MHRKNEIEAILKQVKTWPPEDRLAVAQEILREVSGGQPQPPRDTLSQAIGLFRTNGPPPTDEQVERWLEEDLIAKHLK